MEGFRSKFDPARASSVALGATSASPDLATAAKQLYTLYVGDAAPEQINIPNEVRETLDAVRVVGHDTHPSSCALRLVPYHALWCGGCGFCGVCGPGFCRQRCEAEDMSFDMFDAAQEEIYKLMESDNFARFKKSDRFDELMNTVNPYMVRRVAPRPLPNSLHSHAFAPTPRFLCRWATFVPPSPMLPRLRCASG